MQIAVPTTSCTVLGEEGVLATVNNPHSTVGIVSTPSVSMLDRYFARLYLTGRVSLTAQGHLSQPRLSPPPSADSLPLPTAASSKPWLWPSASAHSPLIKLERRVWPLQQYSPSPLMGLNGLLDPSAETESSPRKWSRQSGDEANHSGARRWSSASCAILSKLIQRMHLLSEP